MSNDRPVSWSHVQSEEQRIINGQRGSAAAGWVGLAFSGGGIRSATFNLGVLQALAKLKLLTRLDYLSTVSGGGYIGGWFQAWFYREYFDLRIQRIERSPKVREKRSATKSSSEAVGDAANSLEFRLSA